MIAEPLFRQVGGRTDWATPWPLFKKYDAEFGFTLDVCATADNAKCARFFTPEQNGLEQDWAGEVCWMNPPYGREIARWMKKAHEEAIRGATVVCLVHARTDTRWWHDWAEKGERRFIKGRLRFSGAQNYAPFPSAIVVFRPMPAPAPCPNCNGKGCIIADRWPDIGPAITLCSCLERAV